MLISKSKGEKLSNTELKNVYGGDNCGGDCGDCDCRASGYVRMGLGKKRIVFLEVVNCVVLNTVINITLIYLLFVVMAQCGSQSKFFQCN